MLLKSTISFIFCWISLPSRIDTLASSFFKPISNILPPNSDFQTRLRAEIANELLLMAVGRHTYFLDGLLMRSQNRNEYADSADSEAIDQGQHIQAAVVLHLLQQLRFMETMDEKLTAAADETASSIREYQTAMQVFYEVLQRKVEQDGAVLMAFMDAEPAVRQWYQQLPGTRRRYAAVRTVPVSSLLRVLSHDYHFVRKLAVCTLFLEASRASSEQRHSKLARNVLQLAQNREAAEHVERIFGEVVDDTAKVADLQDAQKTLDMLCQKMVDKMRSDTLLNSESIRSKICAQ